MTSSSIIAPATSGIAAPFAAPPRILTIAGSDSSGGAGIQADIKTIIMLGGYAMSAITAITAQNTMGVTAIEALSPDLVGAQMDACMGDIGVDAIKIGMMGSPAIASAIAERLEGLNVPIVFDPVMVATTGAHLADDATIAGFERLMACATLTTPNVPELAALGGPDAMAARKICYLAKGGDAPGPIVEDRLVRPGQPDQIWQAPRIITRHTHGTGCTLASAIATLLGAGQPLETAIEGARAFVRTALKAAPHYGAGNGPLGHHAAALAQAGNIGDSV